MHASIDRRDGGQTFLILSASPIHRDPAPDADGNETYTIHEWHPPARMEREHDETGIGAERSTPAAQPLTERWFWHADEP